MNGPELPGELIEGYYRFRSGRLETERARYHELAETGQKPKTMIIGCCDSRAAPETVFDCGPGELFVVRNVANLVPPYAPDGDFHGTSAALEFAVQVLRVENIVVLGHARCGGIQAALEPDGEPLSPGDFIGKWMTLADPAVTKLDDLPPESWRETGRQTTLERLSIRSSIDNLLTFPCVSILHDRGRLAVHGAWFDISTGELWALDQTSGEFRQVKADAV